MKHLTILLFFVALTIFSCRTSRKFQAYAGEDKALFKAINELNRKPENAKAQTDLVALYPQAKQFHEESIKAFTQSRDVKRYDRILNELNALQHIYSSIMATPGTASLLKPKNYLKEIDLLKEEAAEVYYLQGQSLLSMEGRVNSLQAHAAFQKSNGFINGYKDVSTLTRDAYNKSIVNIIINRVEDRNASFSTWGGLNDYSYRTEDFQQLLVNELGGQRLGQYAARFYTDREARREGIQPDWTVDMQWLALDPVRAFPNTYNREVSKEIQIGSDTAGKPVYRQVYATLLVTERIYTVNGDLEYRIRDLVENRQVDYGRLTDEVSWSERVATYRGDSRALSSQDWQLINNQHAYNRNLTREEIMNTLMRKMYPDLRRKIQYALN